jgi:DNA (cytosine-5)-methyltransferase 1
VNKLRLLDLFSGIGGFSLGLERTGGIETVAFCEYAKFPRKVLAKHWPNVPIYPDVRELTAERLHADGLGRIDIICGGYPCQPFSYAGKREGAEDDRHLWPEMRRLVETLRPTWVIGENVAGHITMGLDDVLADLDACGYSAQAFVIPACAVDARHRRDRLWLVAYRDNAGQSASEGRGQDGWNQSRDHAGRGSEAVAYAGRELRQGKFSQSRREEAAQRHEAAIHFEQRSEALADTISERGRGWDGEWQHAVHADACGETLGTGTDGNWWAVEPELGRVAHGVSQRVDRLKALGNAVVPQIPELIGRAILKSMEAA